MPCPILDLDYPDYVKTILKKIEQGDDRELKSCACNLKVLKNDDDCIMLDEDGKAGLLPGCIEVIEEEELENMGYGSYYPFGVSQKQVMKLFWDNKRININGTYLNPDFRPNPSTVNCNAVGGWERDDRTGLIDETIIDLDITPQERIVCETKLTFSSGILLTVKRGSIYADFVTIELFGGPTKRLKNTNIFFPHINIIVDPAGETSENAIAKECTYGGSVIEGWIGQRRVCTNRWGYSCCGLYGEESGNPYSGAFEVIYCATYPQDPCPDYCNGIRQYQEPVGPGPCCAWGEPEGTPTLWAGTMSCCFYNHTPLTWGVVGGIDPVTKRGRVPPRPGLGVPSIAKFLFFGDEALTLYIPYYIGEYDLSFS